MPRPFLPLLLAAGVLTLIVLSRPSTKTASAASVAVTIDGSQTFQTMDGFGVNAIPKTWEGGALKPAIDLLVDMGSTLWRVDVNNGHTTWEAQNDDADPNHFNWDYYTTVYESPQFQDLWSELSYLNQKGVTVELSMSGHVPVWMGDGVIPQAMEDEFVEEIVSLAYYARNVKGIQFHLLSPLNETDKSSPEGPTVDPTQFARIFHKLAVKLDAVGMGDVRLVGPETSSFDQSYTQALMADPTVMAKVDAFAYHNYVGCCAWYSSGFIKQSAYPDRHVWVSEWNQCQTDGCLDGGQQVADEWVFAREMTTELLNHIDGGASAALAWDAWDNWHEHNPCCAIDHWGEVYQDPTTGAYIPKKRYFTNAQVFKFVQPGMVRIAASSAGGSIRVYGFVKRDTGQITIVGQNTTTSPQTLSGTLANLPAIPSLAMYHTDATVNLARDPDVAVTGSAFSVQVPADSFFTLTTRAAPSGTATPSTTPAPTSTPTPTATSWLYQCRCAVRLGPTLTSTPTSTPTPTATVPTVLVGEPTVKSGTDSNSAGQAEAFQYTAAATGTVTQIVAYLDSTSTASSVVVGLYTNTAAGNPGTLLTQGTIVKPANGAWNRVSVPPVAITQGTKYWLAILAPAGAGTVVFRDAASGGPAQNSSQTNLSALPGIWSSGPLWSNSPASIYAAP